MSPILGPERLLQGLNPDQRAAVTHGDGPLLVLAGAGSGKTRVIAHRIAYLVGEWRVPPGAILAVTFTNKAAGEMRQRIEALLGGRTGGMVISTFHSACARLLRARGDRLGLSRTFTIYDSSDSLHALKDALARIGLALPERIRPGALLAAISRLKNELQSPADAAADPPPWPWTTVLPEAYRGYEDILRENEALDFDDLLRRSVELLERTPEVLAEMQARFRHVLVDEYQDTNAAQYRLVKLVAARHSNVCVVGDDDQSIYAFRGARVRNILEFERDFPGSRVVRLERNYRSTQVVLDAAAALASKIPGRHPKRLWTSLKGGPLIQLHAAEDSRQEAAWVAARIQELHLSDGLPLGQIAVFYRVNTLSRSLEEGLRRAGVAYDVVGHVGFYGRREVKDVLAYLTILANPADSGALARVINLPRRGIGATALQRLAEMARERNAPLIDVVLDPEAAGSLRGAARTGLSEFAQLYRSLVAAKSSCGPAALAERVLEETGYLAMLAADRSPEGRSRVDHVTELTAAIRETEEESGADLRAVLDALALVSDADDVPESADKVLLMTLHTAKGLEFTAVFIVGLEEGFMPHARCLDEDGGLAEERRLLYVGFTRARQRLHLSWARSRDVFGALQDRRRSPFLDELPPALVEESGGRGTAAGPASWNRARPGSTSAGGWRRPVAAAPAPVGPAAPEPPRPGPAAAGGRFKLGQRVVHPKFGQGTIVRVSARGAGDALLLVSFERVGMKPVLASKADLTFPGRG